jgi:hypothetical protein
LVYLAIVKLIGIQVNCHAFRTTTIGDFIFLPFLNEASVVPPKRSFENVSQFIYFETTVTNQNFIQEEIKRRLNSGNACHRSVQNLLSSHLLSKNLKIRIYKTIILSVVLYGRETWYQTLREEHRLRVFENWRMEKIA